MTKKSLGAIVLCVGLAIVGCATTPDPTQRTYYDQSAADARQKQASLVIDSCVIRDEVGDDYVLRYATQDVATKTAETVRSHLLSHGFDVSSAVIPFMCGSVKETTEVARIADNSDSEPTDVSLPIPMADRVKDDPEVRNAYHQLVLKVVEAVAADSKESPSRQGQATPLGLSLNQLDMLRRDLGNDQVWVVRAGGVQVSTGKSVGVGVLTSVVSLALSGGTYIYTSTVTDGNGYDVALLNLEANEIIWKKHLQAQAGDPAALDTYDVVWAKSLFDPFLTDSVSVPVDSLAETDSSQPMTDAVSVDVEETSPSIEISGEVD